MGGFNDPGLKVVPITSRYILLVKTVSNLNKVHKQKQNAQTYNIHASAQTMINIIIYNIHILYIFIYNNIK